MIAAKSIKMTFKMSKSTISKLINSEIKTQTNFDIHFNRKLILSFNWIYHQILNGTEIAIQIWIHCDRS